MSSSRVMDDFLGWQASSDDIKKHEAAYNEEMCAGKVTSETQFNYACFLIQSRFPGDVKHGINLLEELYQNPDESGKRDYIYFLAVGNARIKEYQTALEYLKGILAVEPSNKQVLELKYKLEKKLREDGFKAAAVGTGLAVGIGALLIGIGAAIAKK